MTGNAVDVTNAESFHIGARCYKEALRLLSTHPNRVGDMVDFTSLPMSMLTGFAIELYLKAWLQNREFTNADLKKIGHNLKGLLEQAKKAGLPPLAQTDELVDVFHEQHLNHEFRYMKDDGAYHGIYFHHVLDSLDELDCAVIRELASKSK